MSLDIKFFSFLIILLPIALATGPFLPDLFASCLGIFFLYRLYKYKEYEIFKNKIVILLLIFSIYIIFSSIISDNILLSFESSFFYFRFIFFSLAVSYLLNKNDNLLKYFGYSIIFSILFVVIDSYFQLLFGKDIFGIINPNVDGSIYYEGSFNGQLTGIFGDEQILGSYLARMLPLAFALAIFLNKKYIYFLLITLLILSDIAIYLSGERSAFFLLLFSVIIIVFLTKNHKYLRVLSFIVSAILIATISFYDDNSANRMFIKTYNQLGLNEVLNIIPDNLNNYSNDDNNISNNVNDSSVYIIGDLEFCVIQKYKKNNTLPNYQQKILQENINDCRLETINKKNSDINRLILFSSHHENHYFSALKMFRENFLFGVGPKLFREKCSEEKYRPFDDVKIKIEDICSTHPHNTYIQLLSETGIIGFLLIFPLFLLICYKFIIQFINIIYFRKYVISDMEICVLVSLFIFTFPLIPTGSAFNNWLSVVHYLAFGFYLSFSQKKYV